MKQFLALMMIVFSLKCYSQTIDDAIVGKWLKTPKEDLIIEVYREGNQYNGRLSWAKDSEKKKSEGAVILQKLEYDADKQTWKNGSIHDPGSGKKYDAEAKIKSDGTLELYAYMGIKFFGTKKSFKRVATHPNATGRIPKN
jgi:uncharacterized protein (DUF2147 family)